VRRSVHGRGRKLRNSNETSFEIPSRRGGGPIRPGIVDIATRTRESRAQGARVEGAFVRRTAFNPCTSVALRMGPSSTRIVFAWSIPIANPAFEKDVLPGLSTKQTLVVVGRDHDDRLCAQTRVRRIGLAQV
jgi:hypothetical protein